VKLSVVGIAVGFSFLGMGGLRAQEIEGPRVEMVAQGFAAPVAIAPAQKTSPDPAWLLEGSRAAQRRLAEAPRHQGLWRASLVAVLASSTLDAHSSWGKREMNPLLAGADGRFGTRAVAIKSLITGAALGGQWLMLRHKPSMTKYAIIGNFGLAGIYTRVAIHNYGNSR
jgi:hypothetical protein